jgi:hypothetical protein
MPMETSENLRGGCLCGAVNYTIRRDRLPPVYACHCLDCQTWSGSAFSIQCVMPEDVLDVAGDIEIFERKTPSGHRSLHRFCVHCHARIFNTNSARPGIAVVRAGTLVRSDLVNVIGHIWTSRKQPWITIPEGVPTWPESAPMANFIALVTPR